MPREPSQRPDWDRLFEMAAAQAGLFTTGQAAEAGYSTQLLAHHLRSGKVIRRLHGIYRVVDFPAGKHEDLVLAWLWSEREGILSHETALRLHELSDAAPTGLHLTLPCEWKRSRLKVPAGVKLHYADLLPRDRSRRGGVPLTRPARTLSDCAQSALAPEVLRQATQRALRRGLVTRSEIAPVLSALRPFGGLEE